MSTPPRVTATEVRVLEGPNLYFTRPAIKIIADCPGYLSAGERTLRAIAKWLGMRGVRPEAPDSEQRQRAVMRLVAQVVRRIASDRVSAVHKVAYLRGRQTEELEAQLRIGLARVGVAEIESYPSELEGLQALVAIAELRANPDAKVRITAAQALADTDPLDPRLIFDLASAYDSSGDFSQAVILYDRAIGAGLREPHRHQAMIQQASCYRSVGDLAEALR